MASLLRVIEIVDAVSLRFPCKNTSRAARIHDGTVSARSIAIVAVQTEQQTVWRAISAVQTQVRARKSSNAVASLTGSF